MTSQLPNLRVGGGDSADGEEEGESMREIRFRGRAIPSGVWRYASSAAEISDLFFGVDDGQVDAATVGQWTGLKDCKGVDVYEGDTIRFRWDSGKIYNGEVVFGTQNGAWCVSLPSVGTGIRVPLLNMIEETMCAASSPRFKVIGDVHESKEVTG